MADKPEEEVVYTPSTHTQYLESLTEEKDPPVFNESVNPNPFHEDGFVGVSEEYANAANETDEPLQAEEGPEAAAEESFEDAYGDSSGEVSPQLEDAHAKVTRGDDGDTDKGKSESDSPVAKAPAKKTAAKTSESSS